MLILSIFKEGKVSDFFQNGVITTFHQLGNADLKRMEAELREYSKIRPIALVLPSLYREFSSGALPKIMDTIRKVNYLKQIVLCLDRADRSQFKAVKDHFSDIRKLSGMTGRI